MSAAGRYQGFPCPGGILVLDTHTGEVVRVPHDGAPVLLRAPAVVAAPPPRFEQTLPGAAVTPETAIPASPVVVAAPAPAPPAPRVVPPSDPPIRRPAPEPTRDRSLALIGADPFDREVVSSYPYPVAATWLAFLEEPDARQRCKLLVDTFTCVLKLWALQVAAEYLHAPGVRDATLNRTLERDFQRPLISAWNLMIHRGLPVLRQAGVQPFAPELEEAYDALEARCRDRVTVEVRYEDADGVSRFRTSKLGKIQALIRYRNSLAHGYNQSHDKAARDLERYRPVLVDVLKAARFTTRYPLAFRPVGSAGEGLFGHRLMGAWPGDDVEPLPRLDPVPPPSTLFVYDSASHRALPLAPLLDMDSLESGREAVSGLGRDLVLFEGNTRNTVIYASIDGERVEKQSRIREWKSLLADKAVEGPVLTRGNLTAEALREVASRQSAATLDRIVRSGKYVREATVAHPGLEEIIDRFEHGDYRALVLSGDSGVGKSTALARYVDARRAAGDVVLFYRASTLGDADLGIRVLRDLGLHEMFFEDFLLAADAELRDGVRMRVVVDGVNEHPTDAAGLVRSIDDMVRQAKSYPWLRIAVGVRSAAYERLPPGARFGLAEEGLYLRVDRRVGDGVEPSVLVDVPPPPPDMLARMYASYRAYRRPDPEDPEGEGVYAFRPRTAFEALQPDGSTRALMRNPLMMRLLMAAFHRRTLPSELSFDEAMQLYLDHVVVQRDSPEGSYPERRAFLRRLVRELDAAGADSIGRERLYAVPGLEAALQNPQKDSEYVQLLDLGVLLEEWDGEACLVRFAFDGLFEYLLAELHDARIESAEDVARQVRRALRFKNLRGALGVVLRRAAAQGREGLLLDALDVLDEERDSPDARLLLEVATEVVVGLARFRDEGLSRVLSQMRAVPSRIDVEVLVAAFDELFEAGEGAAAEVVAAAIEEARDVGDGRALSNALLRRADLERRGGDLEVAEQTLLESRRVAVEVGDEQLVHRVDMQRGRILVVRGMLDEAEALLSSALEGLSKLDAHRDTAIAIRALASIAGRRDDVATQERLNRESLALAERHGDLTGVAIALNNIAMTMTYRREHEEALSYFGRALAIREQLGNRSGMGTVLLNIGSVHYSQGDLGGAEAHWTRALRIYEAVAHHEGRSMVLANLAILAQMRHRPDEAFDYAEQALALFEERGDPRGIAYALHLVTSFALDRGAVEDARPHAQRLEELAAEMGRQRPRMFASCAALRLAARDGDRAGMDAALARVVALEEELDGASWDVEDGPASAYLDAGLAYLESGDAGAAAELGLRVRDLLAGRPFHRSTDLSRLLPAVDPDAPSP